MVIAGPWFAPMMFNEPGLGRQIVGELYEVDDKGIEDLDRLESVGEPGNFRLAIEVIPVGGGSSCLALTYMKAQPIPLKTRRAGPRTPARTEHILMWSPMAYPIVIPTNALLWYCEKSSPAFDHGCTGIGC
jgi:hypothetical protein